MAARGHNFWQTVVGGVLSMVITLAVLYYYGFKPFKGLLW
jgi:F0F1-type ATP synthase membrane subunit b/b'